MSYKKLILKSSAAIEIEEAIVYYVNINKTLAKKFEKEIRFCFFKISKSPESFQFRYKNIRIIWLKKFPFGIYYLYDSNEVYIIAFWCDKEDIENKIRKV